VKLSVSAGARARLADLGWHPTRGARPLQRVIEERVIAPVAAYLAAHPSVKDAVLSVDAEARVSEGAQS
jgi:ATP-dependent Clp protease ATP-binding subunit ClpC